MPSQVISSLSVLIKAIKDAWNNIKSSSSLNQKRYDAKRCSKVSKSKAQNCNDCSCSK